MRDTNPMPALSQLQRMAKDVLSKHGLELEGCFVIPSETNDGTSFVHLVVQSSANDDNLAPKFDAIVANLPADLQDQKADEAKRNLEALRDKLKKRDNGIL